jgi:predicted enzyme related to lactoylglutathione lyase
VKKDPCLYLPVYPSWRQGNLPHPWQEEIPGINGAVMQRQSPQQPLMNYVDVASIDVAIEKATKLGAQVAMPKMPIPGVGAVAAIIDPQGKLCGLWQKAS